MIADQAGGSWPARARNAALATLGNEKADDDSIGVQLLSDIRQVYLAHGDPAVLSSKQIRDDLVSMDHRPWATWGRQEKPITGHALSRMLRPFGVVPAGDIRLGDKVVKAYRREAFREAWSRYLPADSDSQPLHRNKPNTNGPEPPICEVLHAEGVANAKSQVSPIETGLCCDVALQTADLDEAGEAGLCSSVPVSEGKNGPDVANEADEWETGPAASDRVDQECCQGGPLVLACKLCRQSPTYWQRAVEGTR